MIERYVIRKGTKYWSSQYSCFTELGNATLYLHEGDASEEIYTSDDLQWMFERATIDKVILNR